MSAEWNKQHPEKMREIARRWRANHPEVARERNREYYRKTRDEQVESMRQRHKRNMECPDYRRKKRSINYKHKYGISLDEVERMIAAQENVCLICCRKFTDKLKACVDHCHTSGKIRGILCRDCNGKLGWYEQNSLSVRNYLGE